MKTTLAILTALLAATAAAAQDLSRLHTHPTVPSREALERLNLKLGWRTHVPTEGRRDGVFTVQMPSAAEVLVQMRSGLIASVDADTGRIRWMARPGAPYRVGQPLGFNSRWVFAVNDQFAFAINRATGQTEWSIDMGDGPVAGPVADEEQLFLSLGTGRIAAFDLPVAAAADAGKKGEGDRSPTAPSDKPADSAASAVYGSSGGPASISALARSFNPANRMVGAVGPLSSGRRVSEAGSIGFQLRQHWNVSPGVRIGLTPLITPDSLFVAGEDGKCVALVKGLNAEERYNRRIADASIVVPPGQHFDKAREGQRDHAYVASHDGDLYAIDIANGRVEWRFTSGTPVVYKPAVNDDDVFATPDRAGLHRLDRKTGRAIWQNVAADRFLAANQKFVYAMDGPGRLLVLDRDRGRRLAMLDTRDYVVPIANELTDRIFLAANDGLLVCLHDREYPTAQQMKRPLVLKSVVLPVGRGPGPRPADKPTEKPAEDQKPKPKPKPKGDEMEKPKEPIGDMDKQP